MKISPSRKESGFALVIVMIVIVALSILAGSFASSMKVETHLARRSSYDMDFEWMGRSGVEIARALLGNQAKSGIPFDSLKQQWAGGPGDNAGLDSTGLGNSNSEEPDPFSSLSLANIPVGPGTISLSIVDAERKYNINIADQRILNQATILMGLDAGSAPEITDSILDWIDRDEDEHINGKESDYYENLTPPYQAKNGWVDDMSELLLVYGVSPAVFWGTASADHPLPDYQKRDPLSALNNEEVNYPVGLYDLFTPVSNGKININTAPANTLMLIPGVDTNLANLIIQGRTGQDGSDGTADDTPYTSVGEVPGRIGIDASLATSLQYYCDVRSSVFEVRITCQAGGFSRKYIATLYRVNQRDIRLLTMYWKSEDGKSGGETQETGPGHEDWAAPQEY